MADRTNPASESRTIADPNGASDSNDAKGTYANVGPAATTNASKGVNRMAKPTTNAKGTKSNAKGTKSNAKGTKSNATYRPEQIATKLGISGKIVRAYLRTTFPRPADAKGTTWVLSAEQAKRTLTHFAKRNPRANA